MTAEALTDALWGDELPADPPAALFNQVSRLRRVLGAALRTEPGGYRLDVAADDVDAHAFERLLAAGRAAADAVEAVALLERAVTLWRGPAYARAERGRRGSGRRRCGSTTSGRPPSRRWPGRSCDPAGSTRPRPSPGPR